MENKNIEDKILKEINQKIEELDINLSKMDSAENKLIHFADQEKALHDIKSILRKEKEIDRLAKDTEKIAQKSDENAVVQNQKELIDKISKKIDDLIGTLANVSDDDAKIKSYIDQKEVINDIKNTISKFKSK